MKIKILMVLPALALFCSSAVSQGVAIPPAPEKNKAYKVRISLTDGKVSTGWFRGITEDSIFISIYKHGTIQRNIHYSEIGKLKFRKKNAIRTGLIIGGSTGFASGYIIGAVTKNNLAESDDPFGIGPALSTGIKPATGALLFTPLGAGLGAAIGALSGKRFKINGEKERFLMIGKSLRL